MANVTPPPTADDDARQAIVAGMQLLVTKGLNRGASGNISVRAPGGLWITPSGISPDALGAADIVFIDAEGWADGAWQPSSEWRFHHDILRARPDIHALVHTHSIHATAFAIAREPIEAAHYMIAASGGDRIEVADYALFGTPELSETLCAALGDRRLACLMANHGLVAGGATLAKALWLAEEIETLAQQIIMARQIGTPRLLSAEQMRAVHERFAGYGPKSTSATDR